MENQKTDFENDIDDIDELDNKEIKINPDYYLHNAILKAQAALNKDNIQEGFLQFRILIENAETIAKAAGVLPNDYDRIIINFVETEEFKKEDNNIIKHSKLANYKLQVILKELFSNKTLETPMSIKNKGA